MLFRTHRLPTFRGLCVVYTSWRASSFVFCCICGVYVPPHHFNPQSSNETQMNHKYKAILKINFKGLLRGESILGFILKHFSSIYLWRNCICVRMFHLYIVMRMSNLPRWQLFCYLKSCPAQEDTAILGLFIYKNLHLWVKKTEKQELNS